ncbi:MAG: hypothetical protein LBH87_02275, partial [Coriobacteriales bacterium]|nr:hypothetical protein [Coriobacteriales bacterium]
MADIAYLDGDISNHSVFMNAAKDLYPPLPGGSAWGDSAHPCYAKITESPHAAAHILNVAVTAGCHFDHI